MKLAIVATLVVMASGLASVLFLANRARDAATNFEAQLLDAWPDARRMPPAKKKKQAHPRAFASPLP